ncbi:RNA polymerase sigma factor [Candidatus Gottesmanbacteria bacterium]|nr:RNA polymerase sigma factor [Candidatus Gottesmanbacteria bacterium]
MQEEKDIILKVKRGEINYFEALVKKYSRVAFFYTKKRVKQPSDAEDIVQNSFIKAYKVIERLDENRGFSGYFFAILRNQIVDFYRQKNNDVPLFESLTSQDLENSGLKIDVEELYAKIRPEYKTVLQLYTEGFSYQEIAANLKRPINTIKTLIRRARIEARKLYEKKS